MVKKKVREKAEIRVQADRYFYNSHFPKGYVTVIVANKKNEVIAIGNADIDGQLRLNEGKGKKRKKWTIKIGR